jgi:hypothetical protein
MSDATIIALLAALAPTIASIAALVRVVRLGKTTDQVNRAVNHQPINAPTLVERVIDISSDLKELRVANDILNVEVRDLKNAHRRHLAWHQEVEEL